MKNNEEIWLQTQDALAVVVVFFAKSSTISMFFFSECVFFQKKINNQFWGVIVFLRKVTIFIGRELKNEKKEKMKKINEKL